MLERLALGAARTLDTLAAAAMLGILLVTAGSVASRALFNKPIAGAFETSMLLMPIVVFGGMAWVFARVGHFAMTSLIDARGGKMRPLGLVLQVALGGALFVLFAVESAQLFYDSFLRREYFAGPVNIPVYYSRLAIALGSAATTAVILFVLLPEAIDSMRRKNSEEADP